MFQFTPETTAERARKAIDEGYTAVKFGWEPFGRGDENQDVAFVEAIRKAIGDGVDFMLDVGHVWDAKTTIRRCRLFKPYNLFWIEEPIHPDDLRSYARVSEAVEDRIAAGEQEGVVT